MPLPGGAADKYGTIYEGLWTVHCMLQVMDDKADEIHLEPPHEDGVEFTLRRSEALEYHQAKRQAPESHWTLTQMHREGVLAYAQSKLAGDHCHYHFVSGSSADPLREMSERSRSSESWQVFNSAFLKAKNWRENFDLLHQTYWSGCREPEAVYEALKRIHVEVISDARLRSCNVADIERMVEGDPENVIDILANYALNNVHRRISANDLWRHLTEQRGFALRQWYRDHNVRLAVRQQNEGYLRRLSMQLIDNSQISRDETNTILAQLSDQSAPRGAFLVGEAGLGKSGVIMQVVQRSLERGWQVLAFRLDALPFISHPSQAGQHLGLPGSPDAVLTSLARGKDCLLVIDQLDAVSQVSGRHPEMFELVEEICHRISHLPNVHLILGCRTFDLDNDDRFRHMLLNHRRFSRINLRPLPTSTILEVIQRHRPEARKLSQLQERLFSNPFRLKLLSEILSGTSTTLDSFQTYQSLLDGFWKAKLQNIDARRPPYCGEALEAIAQYMSRNQALQVPEEQADPWQSAVDWLVSENVLVKERRHYAFFHESFFDYVFARQFCRTQNDLAEWLAREEQHLFRRAQVRQILEHQRSYGSESRPFSSYLLSLRNLLVRTDIRAHIKAVVFALLRSVADPAFEEWELLDELRRSDNFAMRGQVTRVQWSSPWWFDLLNHRGMIAKWLDGPDEALVTQTLLWLAYVHDYYLDRLPLDSLSRLLGPRFDLGGIWNDRRRQFVSRVGIEKSRWSFDLFLTGVVVGDWDQSLFATVGSRRDNASEKSDFWGKIYFLAENASDWACESLRVYFERFRSVRQSDPTGLSIDWEKIWPSSDRGERIFKQCAAKNPGPFLHTILPFVLEAIEQCRNSDRTGRDGDIFWTYYNLGGTGNLLQAMTEAMESLACTSPSAYLETAAPLHKVSYRSIQYILMRGYQAGGATVANQAVDLALRMMEQKAVEGDHLHWAAEMLRGVARDCDQAHFKKLEDAIVNYERLSDDLHGFWLSGLGQEQPRDVSTLKYRLSCWRRERGRAQYVLLKGLPPDRRTSVAQLRFLELERRFPGLSAHQRGRPKQRRWPGNPPMPLSPVGGYVSSPIPAVAARHMSDEEWIREMTRHSSDWGGHDSFTGGAFELSRVLEGQVKLQPERFTHLAQVMPENLNPAYFKAILSGVADADLTPVIKMDLCRRCHGLPGKPCGREIVRVIAKFDIEHLPAEAIEFITWYATEDPDPVVTRSGAEEALLAAEAEPVIGENGEESPPDPLNINGVASPDEQEPSARKKVGLTEHALVDLGLSTVRGFVAFALGDVLWNYRESVEHLRPCLDRLTTDPVLSVRACAARAIEAVLRHDRSLAIHLLLRLCEGQPVELVADRTVEHIVSYGMFTHPHELLPIVEQLLCSEHEDFAVVGARLATYAALEHAELSTYLGRCIVGQVAMRLGVAEVCAGAVQSATVRSACESALRQLFDDPEAGVRSAAARWIFLSKGTSLNEFRVLLDAYIESRAFLDESRSLFQALTESTAHLPESTVRACERFLRNGDTTQSMYELAHDVVPLILRCYQQTASSPILQARCLDLMDAVALVDLDVLEKGLESFER